MTRSQTGNMALVGWAAGTISFASLWLDIADFSRVPVPGFVFGLLMMLPFRSCLKHWLVRCLVSVITSAVAFVVAILAIIHFSNTSGSSVVLRGFLSFGVAGLVGSAILAMAFSILLNPRNPVGFITKTVCVGTMAGVVFGFLPLALGIIPWQASVAAILGPVLREKIHVSGICPECGTKLQANGDGFEASAENSAK